jgi:hypothetical protein
VSDRMSDQVGTEARLYRKKSICFGVVAAARRAKIEILSRRPPMAVAELANATVAVALNDRAIGAKSARLPRFTHATTAKDHRVVVLGTNVDSARSWLHSPPHGWQSPLPASCRGRRLDSCWYRPPATTSSFLLERAPLTVVHFAGSPPWEGSRRAVFAARAPKAAGMPLFGPAVVRALSRLRT